MTHAIVLTTAPGRQLAHELVSAFEAVLLEQKDWFPDCKKEWLAAGEAWRASFAYDGMTYNLPASKWQQLKELVSGSGVDANLIALPRPAKLLIADMDSTIIQQECIDEIADFVGKKAEVSAITERAMRGELEFESALRERVALLKGLPAETLQQVAEERITLTPGARTLVQTMNAHGAKTALISGGFTFFTEHVAKLTGFQTNQANELIIKDGVLTGEVAHPILGKQAKLAALLKLAKGNPENALAVGDGANDLAMIEAAGLGVAFHAKPVVAAQAYAQINHSDLTALLYLQGYTKEEFVS